MIQRLDDFVHKKSISKLVALSCLACLACLACLEESSECSPCAPAASSSHFIIGNSVHAPHPAVECDICWKAYLVGNLITKRAILSQSLFDVQLALFIEKDLYGLAVPIPKRTVKIPRIYLESRRDLFQCFAAPPVGFDVVKRFVG
jgi:hypothetical protein